MPFLARTLLATWLAISLSFVCLRHLPGDAISAQLTAGGADRAYIDAQRERYGLNQSILSQYLTYWRDLARGDLGRSYLSGLEVVEIIRQPAMVTARLASAALVIGAVLGIIVGVAAGYASQPVFRSLAHIYTTLALSLPSYWTGILSLALLGTFLPSDGDAGGELARSFLMPAALLGFHSSGAVAVITRDSVRGALGANFNLTARAKGLPERIILHRHILRAVLPPIIRVIGLGAGYLFSGVVVIEGLFLIPGLGGVVVNAVTRRDYPVVQGVVALVVIIIALISLVVAALTWLLDPRVRTDEGVL